MRSISVVITTLDDRMTVRDCLDGVLGGAAPVAEVLVVDRGSVDGTLDIVRGAGSPIRLIECPSSPPDEALATGVSQAQGEVLALVPSRAILGAGAIEMCATATAGEGRVTLDLHPFGTSAFGRGAAAMVGRDVPRVEARTRPQGVAHGRSLSMSARPSSYLVAESPVRLAVEALSARPGWRVPASAALLGAAAGMAVFGRGWLRAAVPLGHAVATALRALRAGRDPGVAPHRAFLAAEVWDWSTGAGWWLAGARHLRGAP